MKVTIRNYIEKDFMEMLDVTMELWNLKMQPYTKKNIEINTNIIKDTGTISSILNEGIIIAEVDGEIAGVAHLDFIGKKVSEGKSLGVFKLILKYGLFNLLRVRDMGRFFEHRVEKDELHIHGIVVSKKYRSLGVGSKLFEKIEEIGREKKLKKITLEVLDSNVLAYKLYNKLGFSDVSKTEFSKKQKNLFKSQKHIYMMKELKENI